MSTCASLIGDAASGVAPTLRAVDCMAEAAAAGGFGHLLGPQGVLAPALGAALTIWVALYGFALLSGRVQLGISGIAGRMLGLGLVLAFATSWAVYGPVVWQLATRGPDQIAGAVLGTPAGAGDRFAARVDAVFSAVNDATRAAAEAQAARAAEAQAAQAPGAVTAVPARPAPPAPTSAGFAPSEVASLGAIVLLLATLGVLVGARIVLAALLLAGPVFVVTALFAPARALFFGWLRMTALAAFVPMLVTLGGAFTLELAVPVVQRLSTPDGIDAEAASGLFMIAVVHASLMLLGLRVGGGLAAGWSPATRTGVARTGTETRLDPQALTIGAPPVRLAPAMPGARAEAQAQAFGAGATVRTINALSATGQMRAPAAAAGPAAAAPSRAQGLGSRFRPAHPGVRR